MVGFLLLIVYRFPVILDLGKALNARSMRHQSDRTSIPILTHCFSPNSAQENAREFYIRYSVHFSALKRHETDCVVGFCRYNSILILS